MTDQAEKQPFWEELGLPAPNSRISFEDYQALPEVNFHMEWHDGVVIYPNWNEETMSPSATPRHQLIVVQLIALLLRLIPNGRVLTAPLDVHFGTRTVQPDVFWVSEDSDCTFGDNFMMGAPDLVVEILSPNNVRHDRGTKYDLYEQNGVKEYWVVEPKEEFVEVYHLKDGKFQRLGAFVTTDTFQSPALGQSVPVKDIFDI